MNKKSLILAVLLVLTVFLATSAISAQDASNIDNNDSDIMEVFEDNDIAAGKEVTVETTDTNAQIQEKINSLNDGDTLNFQKGTYENVSLYVNKSITINGNGATLKGYDTLSNATINPIIFDKTTEGGYAITNLATLYLLETKNLVLKDITIVAGAHSGTSMGKDPKYSNAVIYAYKTNLTTISNTTIDGCSWGIWLQNCENTLIENNNVKNQGITGILSFQSPRSKIKNNTVTNAKNHGIDVRHQLGPNAQIINNTVIGAKEGIYLLHSKGHVVTENKIIDCSLSSVTCCGASNINIYDNKFYYSRIGVLLGGGAPVGGTYTGYNNVTIGTNEWKLDALPFPPSFCYYVAEAKGDYASVDAMMGTHTDSSKSNETYTEFSEIKVPGPIVIDYDTLLKPTETNRTITQGMTNAEIQEVINGMSNGDTLIFEKNAVFENITIYIEKSIKVIGNNATLISYNSASLDLVPERVKNKTSEGGFGITYSAVLYCLNASNIVVSDLNIKGMYPGYDSTSGINQNLREYCTAGIYSILSPNLTITNCNVEGASWGMFIGERQQGRPNALITNNKVSNQYTTGIICFGSANSIIANNTITNAVNHGIDVRFNQGKNVTVYNNTITGSKDGIYLLHSSGHKVYGNTIKQSKISSITCYGSNNICIFNNTLMGSRIAIMLGGNGGLNPYYNITIGKNSFTPDKLPFPPTFEYFLVQSESRYYPTEANPAPFEGTYYDSQKVNLVANNVTLESNKNGTFEITLKDSKGNAIANKTGSISIGETVYSIKTDANGKASIELSLPTGNYTAKVYTVSDYYNKAGNAIATITVKDAPAPTPTPTPAPEPAKVTKKAVKITAKKKTFKAKAKNKKYTITLKAANKAVKGLKVTLKVKGKTYKATTNAKGKATFNLKKLTKKGKYSAVIKFKGTGLYKAATKKVKITVKK
ncbi:MAG: right-handed parallel beta-helix repeat-containing protein [Methanobrevibacter sp.]|nr:right-handed parallel beta-helix repeat-containing protein [Methanobrevibacter sp.]